MNKALLDTDIYSEILKGVNATVVGNAAVYRQVHGVLSLSTITVMEAVQGFQKIRSLSSANALLIDAGGLARG